MQLPFALSPSHFISNVGADAGFAALIGLAILVLLYFAHAREAKSQREELAAARQRIETLELRLGSGAVSAAVPVVPKPAVAAAAGLDRSATGATGAPATAAASTGVATPAKPPAPAPAAAPAGVAAPALIDATRVVPAFEQLAQPVQADGRGSALPAQPLSAPDGTGTGTPAPSRPAAVPVRPAIGSTPSPVTAAAGGNGSASRAAAEGLRPGSLLREGLPRQRRGPSARVLVAVLLVAVAIAAAAVVVVVLRSGGASSTHKPVHRGLPSQMSRALKTVVPSSVTVAVLNGTTVNQLAHRTGQRLTAQGFKEGQLATASDQNVSKTTVGYLPGHRLAALVVAHALKLTAGAVIAAQAASKALACPGTGPCAADVIVTVGLDLAHAP